MDRPSVSHVGEVPFLPVLPQNRKAAEVLAHRELEGAEFTGNNAELRRVDWIYFQAALIITEENENESEQTEAVEL